MRLTRRNSARTSIDRQDVGVLAHAIEDDLPAVESEVEVTNREVQTEVGQLAFGPLSRSTSQKFLCSISPHESDVNL
jgi:hypothetical protein